ncbi:hypothetical protein DL98DRAFT_607613 [Cadophora sp. DSE1049]|nr:hypothetical protein DL98DRAFT_607613 [Cadophora sp. DSE1049]
MSFLTKAARPSKRSAIHIFKHNTLRSCAAMSTILNAIKKDYQKIKEIVMNINRYVKDALYKFQKLTPENPEFIPTFEALMKDVNQHMKEEENNDLPALERAIQNDESESIAKSFSRTKAFVPSRSHPNALNKPPFETVIGLMTAPIDHLGDLFRKFPDKTISPNPSTK